MLRARWLIRATLVVALVVTGAIAARSAVRPLPGGAGGMLVRIMVAMRTRAHALAVIVRDPSALAQRDAELVELRTRAMELERALAIAQDQRAPAAPAAPVRLRSARPTTIRAPVLAGVFGPHAFELTVDVGARAGVAAGAPVLVHGALIGIVERVGADRAVIALLANPGTRIPVELASAPGSIGVLTASAGGGVAVAYIPGDREVPDGAPLVTGIEYAHIPRGIPVGRIRGMQSNPDGFFRSAVVETLADPRSVYAVEIIDFGETTDDGV